MTAAMVTGPIRIRAQLRGDTADVRLLMPHPMETGLRRDAGGAFVPLHHITEVVARVGARTVFAAQLGLAVSRDPLLAFRFSGARAGQRLQVRWTDSRGDSRSDETVIA
jgi:sulfur-oxidizing protein SoxZ